MGWRGLFSQEHLASFQRTLRIATLDKTFPLRVATWTRMVGGLPSISTSQCLPNSPFIEHQLCFESIYIFNLDHFLSFSMAFSKLYMKQGTGLWQVKIITPCVCVSVCVCVCVCVCESLSHVWLFVAPWTVVHQAPLSMGFPQPEYCSGLAFSSPSDLPNPEIKSCISCIGKQILYQLSHQGSP